MICERVTGNPGIKVLECTNPARNLWRIRWDVTETGDGSVSFMEAEVDHRPSLDEVKEIVIGCINDDTQKRILEGMTYEGTPVWLSMENQMDYNSAVDLATMTGGGSLPVKFKFGTEANPVYRTFDTVEDLCGFYSAVVRHIQDALEAGWEKKDSVDWSQYE